MSRIYTFNLLLQSRGCSTIRGPAILCFNYVLFVKAFSLSAAVAVWATEPTRIGYDSPVRYRNLKTFTFISILREQTQSQGFGSKSAALREMNHIVVHIQETNLGN